jgi:hypothetical protein
MRKQTFLHRFARSPLGLKIREVVHL